MKYKILILIIIFLFSCTNPFAPKLVKDNLLSSAFLTSQQSPLDVLTNFRYAYTFKDSLIYSELLDSTFTFLSWNFATPTPSPISWGRDEDLTTTARLFNHFQDINLTWGDTLNPNINEEEVNFQINFTLTFDNGREIPTLKGVAFFNFIKKNRGKWYINRWEDLISF